jgi:hypothetical protein
VNLMAHGSRTGCTGPLKLREKSGRLVVNELYPNLDGSKG